jgi:hypothetical protein
MFTICGQRPCPRNSKEKRIDWLNKMIEDFFVVNNDCEIEF